MKITRRIAAAIACLTFAAVLCSETAMAQAFPSKPITIIVPYAAGGSTDATARRVAELMAKLLGTSVVVENKTGAATVIAASYVAKAPKDGYTLLFAPGTTTSANPHLFKSLPYSIGSFAPVSMISRQPFVLTASASLKIKSLSELIEHTKSNPNGFTIGTTGVGSLAHVIGEWIGRTTHTKVVPIHYQGTAQGTIDLLGGRLDTLIEAISSSVPRHTSGKSPVLAVMSDERSPALPDVPTFKELGYAELVAYINWGLLAPAGTPPAIVEKLRIAVAKSVSDPDLVAKLSEVGEIAESSNSAQEYKSYLEAEQAKWGVIIKPLKLELQ